MRKRAMTKLFIAWRPAEPEPGGWRPVGQLEYDKPLYRFCYTRGAQVNRLLPIPVGVPAPPLFSGAESE